jgi:hypothetical protein
MSGFESLRPSQFSFRTTNHRAAGVCDCFERSNYRPAGGRKRLSRPQLQHCEELRPLIFRSNPEQFLPRAAVRTAKSPRAVHHTVPIEARTARLRCGQIGMLRIGVLADVKTLAAMASGELAFGYGQQAVAR